MEPELNTQSDDDWTYPEDDHPYPEEDFKEADYDQLDRLSAAEDYKPWDLHF